MQQFKIDQVRVPASCVIVGDSDHSILHRLLDKKVLTNKLVDGYIFADPSEDISQYKYLTEESNLQVYNGFPGPVNLNSPTKQIVAITLKSINLELRQFIENIFRHPEYNILLIIDANTIVTLPGRIRNKFNFVFAVKQNRIRAANLVSLSGSKLRGSHFINQLATEMNTMEGTLPSIVLDNKPGNLNGNVYNL